MDPELRQEAWNRIVHMAQGGPTYSGQNLTEKQIYFVDAKAALEGRLCGSQGEVGRVRDAGV